MLSWFGFNTITEKDGFPITESRLFSLILARENRPAIAGRLLFLKGNYFLIGNGWLVCSALVEFCFAFRQRFAAFLRVLLIKDAVQGSFPCPAVCLIQPLIQPSALLLFLFCRFWNSRYCEPPSTIACTSAIISCNSSGVGFSNSRRIK